MGPQLSPVLRPGVGLCSGSRPRPSVAATQGKEKAAMSRWNWSLGLKSGNPGLVQQKWVAASTLVLRATPRVGEYRRG